MLVGSHYTYDAVGNRTDDGRTYNAANQVIGWQYDTRGNLLSDGTTTYAYDVLGRMTALNGVAQTYNADGVLVQSGATSFVQDLLQPLPQVLTDGATDYLYGADRLAAATTAARTWYAADALGSVRLTTSDTGAALSSIDYDPWGAVVRGTPARFGFTGELQQGSSVHLRARWYNATSGSFGSVDPYAGDPASPASLAPYMYAYNQPTLFTDPSGRCIPWIESGCEFIGWDNVLHGRFNTKDFLLYSGRATVNIGTFALGLVGCVVSAGLACIAVGAGSAAVASWGNQALDNAGKPVGQAITQVDWASVAKDAAIGAISSSFISKGIKFQQFSGFRSYVGIGALVNGTIGALSTAFEQDSCIYDIASSFIYNAALGGLFTAVSYSSGAFSKVFLPFKENIGFTTYASNIIGGMSGGLASNIANNFFQGRDLSENWLKPTIIGGIGGVVQSYDYMTSLSPESIARTKAEKRAQDAARGITRGRRVWDPFLEVNRSRSGEFFGDLFSGALSFLLSE